MLAMAANGISSTSTARMRSLATITRLCSQRSTNVPAMGAEEDVRQRRGEEDEPGRERRVGDRVDKDGQRHLVEPVAEEADRLRQPERGESGVQRQSDVGVSAHAGAQRGPRRQR